MSRRTTGVVRQDAARRWMTRCALAVVLAGAVVAPAAAQRSGDRARTPEERAQLEQRFRDRMARMVQERLGLDASESAALDEVTRRFDERRRALGREEGTARRQVEDLLASDGGQDDQARALLDRLVTLRNEESALFEEEQAALLEVLTPRQVLELNDFRRELGQRIRALRNRNDGASRGRRPGGDGEGSHEGARHGPDRASPVGEGNVDGLRGVALFP